MSRLATLIRNLARYATGAFASPSLLGFDDAEAQIGLGGGATEHPHCDGPAADFARDDLKRVFHSQRNIAGEQRCGE